MIRTSCFFYFRMEYILLFFVIFVLFYVTDANFYKKEGSPCQWLNATGTCVNPRRCPSFYSVDSKAPICSFQGVDPIICCVDCKLLSEEEADKDYIDKIKTGRKYEENCRLYERLLDYTCKGIDNYHQYKRVWNETNKCYSPEGSFWLGAGGEDALRGDFPHMALLGYGEDMESAQWLCGGSLISERHILTAAHCGSHIQLGPVKYVALGMLKRSDPPHYWKRYRVKVFYPHPEYKPPQKYHDIAIIETATSVNLTRHVLPACLTHKLQFPGDEVAFATGWGALGPGKEKADVMQKVVLIKFTEAQCAELYPAHRHLRRGYNHSTLMCYGDHTHGRDTCEGDSGGPLQKRDPSATFCMYSIIGVTSSGHACGRPGQAGLYTRVSFYLPWIESVLWP